MMWYAHAQAHMDGNRSRSLARTQEHHMRTNIAHQQGHDAIFCQRTQFPSLHTRVCAVFVFSSACWVPTPVRVRVREEQLVRARTCHLVGIFNAHARTRTHTHAHARTRTHTHARACARAHTQRLLDVKVHVIYVERLNVVEQTRDPHVLLPRAYACCTVWVFISFVV
jgi:hypothetical protein